MGGSAGAGVVQGRFAYRSISWSADPNRVRRGGKEAGGETATVRNTWSAAASVAVGCAYEARRSGRASIAWRSPMSIKGPSCRRGGCAGKAVGLIRGGLCGCPRMPRHAWRVRGVVRDGRGREAAARRRAISRGRSTSGDRYCWEGPNAKPSAKTSVLVVVALIAANPFGVLAGSSKGEA